MLDSDRVIEPVERVNRSNSDGSIAHRHSALNHCTMISVDQNRHRKSLDGHLCQTVHAQDLKTSLNELQERIQLQVLLAARRKLHFLQK